MMYYKFQQAYGEKKERHYQVYFKVAKEFIIRLVPSYANNDNPYFIYGEIEARPIDLNIYKNDIKESEEISEIEWNAAYFKFLNKIK